MTRQRARTRGRNVGGQGRDVDIGSQPVESTEHREESMDTALRQPRAQAFWVALPLAVAVVVTTVSPIALGPRIFWAVTGVCALAAFLWSVQFEMRWQDRVSLPVVAGGVAWCFWRFADWQGWRAPERWQPWAALGALGALVFCWSFVGASSLTFIQRLGMPMFHQQFHLWKAIGSALETFLGIVMKRPPAPTGERPLLNKSSFRRAVSELPEREPDDVETLSEIELFLMLARDEKTIKRDGGLAGLAMANGQKVSKNLWARNMALLHEQGFVTNGGSGYAWTLGQSAETALDALV